MVKKLSVFIIMVLTINSLSADENVVSAMAIDSDSSCCVHKSENMISRNLFVEFAGPSFGIGIGYDQRFKANSNFGFRAGVSFTNGYTDDNGWFGAMKEEYTEVDFKGVTFPLEVNAIMGKRASKFELGLGATPCILNRYEERHIYSNYTYNVYNKEGIKLNFFGTLNIGYRLQRKSGFFLRAGMTFVIGDLKCSPMDGIFLIPNLSLGYTIREK